MFHRLRILYLIIPPYSLVILGIILVICILSLFLSLWINKKKVIQLGNNQQSVLSTIFALFLISEVAMVITTLFMTAFTNIVIGPLTRVHNEWGIAANNAFVDLVAYYAIYGLIYANSQFLSAFVLRRPLGNRFAPFFVCFLTLNTGIWVIGNLILGLLGIPY